MNRDPKELTRESYEKNASHFIQKFEKPFSAITLAQLNSFANQLNGKKVLDAGCGTGIFAKWLLEKGFDVIGIDISEPLLTFAKNRGVCTQLMDFEHITFSPETFDGIWAMSSLLHVPKKNMTKVLSSFHTILKQNGILFVTLKEGIGEKIIADTQTSSRFFSFWTIEEFCKLTQGLFEVLDAQEEIVNNQTFIRISFRKC